MKKIEVILCLNEKDSNHLKIISLIENREIDDIVNSAVRNLLTNHLLQVEKK